MYIFRERTHVTYLCLLPLKTVSLKKPDISWYSVKLRQCSTHIRWIMISHRSNVYIIVMPHERHLLTAGLFVQQIYFKLITTKCFKGLLVTVKFHHKSLMRKAFLCHGVITVPRNHITIGLFIFTYRVPNMSQRYAQSIWLGTSW